MKSLNKKHFAKALTQMGREKGIFDTLISDLTTVSEKLNENLELKQYLSDPHISITDKKKALKVVFQDFVSEITYNFVFLLIKSKKLSILDSILEQAKKDYLAEDEIFEVVVESVVPMTANQEKKLVSILNEKLSTKVVVKNIINEKLIGGLRLQLDDQVIDSSITGKISRLQSKISNL